MLSMAHATSVIASILKEVRIPAPIQAVDMLMQITGVDSRFWMGRISVIPCGLHCQSDEPFMCFFNLKMVARSLLNPSILSSLLIERGYLG